MKTDKKNSEFNVTVAPWLGKTSKLLNICISNVLHGNNVPITKEQWVLLKILHEDQDGFVQNDLALLTERNKASLTRLIDGMENNNMVVRIPSKEDSRKKLIYITKTGTSIFLQTKPLILELLNQIEEGVSLEEKQQLVSTMKKLQLNIKNLLK